MLLTCRTCKAVELLAAACLRLGISPDYRPLNPSTGQPMPDPAHNPYTSSVPLPLRQHLTALLPGMNALLHTQIGSCVSPKGHEQLKDWVPCFLRMPVVQAVLKVCAPTCLLPVYYCLSTTACLLLFASWTLCTCTVAYVWSAMHCTCMSHIKGLCCCAMF